MELWYTEEHSENVRFSIKVDEQLYSAQSPFQRIDVFSSKEFGKFFTLDGLMMVTEKDEFIYHDMIVHVPMAVNPKIEKVLVIGAGDGGTVRELTRYETIKHIDMVEIDKMVVDVCIKYLPQTACKLDDKRVNLLFEDGLKFVRTKVNEYDLIIVDSTDPFGPGEGLFTKEFYGNCFNALKEDGILVNQHETPYYESYAKSMQRAHKRINEFFPVCAVIGIIELLLLCFPLYLNMKRWIVLLDNGFLPLRCAFSYFSSFTEYKKAFCFTSFRALALFASVFICFLPSSLLLTILSKLSPESGLWLIVCFVLSAVLFLLGCFFCYYLIAGMFLSDYLFIEGQVSSPLKAIRLSFSMMHGHRFRLLCVIGYRIPYLLLSVFIVSLPLTLPIIESTFAVLAHDILLTHQSEIDATIQ